MIKIFIPLITIILLLILSFIPNLEYLLGEYTWILILITAYLFYPLIILQVILIIKRYWSN